MPNMFIHYNITIVHAPPIGYWRHILSKHGVGLQMQKIKKLTTNIICQNPSIVHIFLSCKSNHKECSSKGGREMQEAMNMEQERL